jgi:hypothetical protein
MFSIDPGSTQVYSPFGSFVVEQHDGDHLTQHIDRLPRANVSYGSDHPLAQKRQDKAVPLAP